MESKVENVHQDKLMEFITERSLDTTEMSFCFILKGWRGIESLSKGVRIVFWKMHLVVGWVMNSRRVRTKATREPFVGTRQKVLSI